MMPTSRSAIVVAILASLGLLTLVLPAAAAEGKASVKGTVTLDGKPLPLGKVSYHAKGVQPVGSKINKDGTYKVGRIPPGTYTVTVEAMKNGRSLVPAKFSQKGTSPLRVEVKAGSANIDIDLKSK
jgi:hypothetical protein